MSDRDGQGLNQLLIDLGMANVDAETADRFEEYCSLLIRWNARLNLTAVRDRDGILRRHFIESIACARALPGKIETLLDFGSGAGFPGVPIAICRPDISVTLAESNGKKAAFLREVARVLEITMSVYGGRGGSLTTQFDCVTLRAVDKMHLAVVEASKLVSERGWLAVMSTAAEWSQLQQLMNPGFVFESPIYFSWSESSLIALGRRADVT